MSGVKMIEVKEADDGMRLDRWFRLHYPMVRQGQLQRMLRKGQVRVDGGRVQTDRRVCVGEVVRVPPIEESDETQKPRARPLVNDADKTFIRGLVLHEDDQVLVLNKPFGLAVQGGAKQVRHIDGMLDVFTNGGERPRLVHRLDRDTGGVLVLGKTRKITAFLAESFRLHKIEKTYWALARSVPHPLAGRIDLAISKQGEKDAERIRPGPNGKRAITDFQVVEMAGKKACFIALRPITGRTHQIRVHLSSIGTPIVGDRKYGGEFAILEGVSPRMHLFCRTLTIPLPGRKPLTVTAPLTDFMAETWAFFSFPDADNLEWPQ